VKVKAVLLSPKYVFSAYVGLSDRKTKSKNKTDLAFVRSNKYDTEQNRGRRGRPT
jgi:hypothetical protein